MPRSARPAVPVEPTIADLVAVLVDDAPALTAEQRARLANLLPPQQQPSTSDGAADAA